MLRIREIWDQVSHHVSDQIAVLERAARAMEQQTLSEELQREAEWAAHKLAGSLGSFGLREGARLARRIDRTLRRGKPLGAVQGRRLTRLAAALRAETELRLDAGPVEQLAATAEQLCRKNEELEEQNRRMQEANRLKTEFLANMSHELRTPLHSIIGFAELIHDGKAGEVSPLQQEYLNDILTSSRHLLHLIEGVLDMAKVEAGKLEICPENVDMFRLVDEIRSLLSPLAAQKRMQVETMVDPELHHITADPVKLKQVLYNYLSNALKFTRAGGQVTIRVTREDAAHFRISVTDNGIGIHPEDIPKLFMKFQQLDGGSGKRYPGTGLGLALTKRIVEAQGGWVGVSSTPGAGSLFYAVMPLGPVVAAEGLPAPEPVDLPSVLVIDSSPTCRANLARKLRRAGYRAVTASSGAEALTMCREQTFDAIAMEVMLSDMSGYDVLQALGGRLPPTVLVTEHADLAARRSNFGFPVHDILSKPVGERLVASLEQAGIVGVRRRRRHRKGE